MKRYGIIFYQELKELFLGIPTILLCLAFLLLMSAAFITVLHIYLVDTPFQSPWLATMQLFWIPVWIVIPVLCMARISLERSSGLLEALFTTPVRKSEYIFAKFSALWIYFMTLWLLFFSIVFLATSFLSVPSSAYFFNPVEFWGTLYFLGVASALYLAIGIFVSSVIKSVLLSGFVTVLILFFATLGPRFFLGSMIDLGQFWNASGESFLFLQEALVGIVDTRVAVLYLGLTLLLLALSSLLLRVRAR